MDINFLGKCEYFRGDSVNASCFNVNSGSAHVTHTPGFFSRWSLSQFVKGKGFFVCGVRVAAHTQNCPKNGLLKARLMA